MQNFMMFSKLILLSSVVSAISIDAGNMTDSLFIDKNSTINRELSTIDGSNSTSRALYALKCPITYKGDTLPGCSIFGKCLPSNINDAVSSVGFTYVSALNGQPIDTCPPPPPACDYFVALPDIVPTEVSCVYYTATDYGGALQTGTGSVYVLLCSDGTPQIGFDTVYAPLNSAFCQSLKTHCTV